MIQPEPSELKKLARRRRARGLLAVFILTLMPVIWATREWQLQMHPRPIELLWLTVVPLVASLLLVSIMTLVTTLLPARPMRSVTALVTPLIHLALMFTVASLMTQRQNPILNLEEWQRYASVWTETRLLVPIGGLQLVALGIAASLDQLWFGPKMAKRPSSK